MADPIIRVTGLTKVYPPRTRRGHAHLAVNDVSFQLWEGESLGIVGESGSGKTTISNCLVGLVRPTAGRIEFRGRDLGTLSGRERRKLAPQLQIVFQDPYGSLNPRMRVGEVVAEPLVVHRAVPRAQLRERVAELLTSVGLDPDYADRFPRQLSGGQAQRVSIARALALQPEVLVLDEPVSALDLSVQAQVLALLQQLKRERGLSYVFVSHDLAVVARMCDRILVMCEGNLVEEGRTDEVFGSPRHPYTQHLLSTLLDPALLDPTK